MIGGTGLFEMGEMRALNPLLPHPDKPRIESNIKAAGARAKHDHAAPFRHKGRDRKGLFPRMFENQIDIFFAGNIPDRFAEFAGLGHKTIEFG